MKTMESFYYHFIQKPLFFVVVARNNNSYANSFSSTKFTNKNFATDVKSRILWTVHVHMYMDKGLIQ